MKSFRSFSRTFFCMKPRKGTAARPSAFSTLIWFALVIVAAAISGGAAVQRFAHPLSSGKLFPRPDIAVAHPRENGRRDEQRPQHSHKPRQRALASLQNVQSFQPVIA